MAVPRSWTNIEKQRSPEQTAISAEPTATDIRFKLAASFLLASWLTIIYSLQHSAKHYRNRAQLNQVFGFIKYTPKTFCLTLLLSLIMAAYQFACSFDFSISPLNMSTNLGIMYGLGWGMPLLIVLVQLISGYFDANEDIGLLRQRRNSRYRT